MLQKEESAVSTVILSHLIDDPPVKKVKKIDVSLQQRLTNLCSDYNEGRKNLDEVLRGLGHNISSNIYFRLHESIYRTTNTQSGTKLRHDEYVTDTDF